MLAGAMTSPSPAAAESDSARLPPTAVPRHYDIHYTSIDLVRHSFDGVVSIDVDISESVAALRDAREDLRDAVVLHALDVDVIGATATPGKSAAAADSAEEDEGAAGGVAAASAYEFRYHRRNETVTVVFPPGTLAPGRGYTLALRFTGTLNPDMHGLYRSTYAAPDGRSLTVACTQFEATDARRAFPCFDEPALKATFRLRVTIPLSGQRPGLTALSNTPVEEVRTRLSDDGTPVKTFTFGATPVMSTYLLALLVGEFDFISKTSPESGVVTSVYAVPGKARQGKFCLDVASKCLDFYAELFGVEYPLSKSDLVAVPDFAAGAMENWGLVTYREAKILVRPGSTSETTRRGIARTVCHELAHQWFGNLVTMEFWTQLWLKEGVARYMEFVGVDAIFPEWDIWTEFVQGVYGLALGLDSMASSHPVEVEVRHPDEIREIFDSISYAKGASIVRMMASYVGNEAFLRGMKLYLKRHAYGNADSPMLWKALEEASGKPVVEMALPWTLRTGFPILLLPGEEGGEIRTPRFLASGPPAGNGCGGGGSGGEDDDDCVAWPIPVTALVQGTDGPQGPWVLNGPDGDQSSELLSAIRDWTASGRWFKLNASQAGFYRVAYAPAQRSRLADVLSPDGPLPASDRLGLLSDSFAAGRAGYAPTVDSLGLALRFAEHRGAPEEFAVWQELSENLASLASLYRSAPFFDRFKTFLRRVYANQMAALGWDARGGESQRTGTLRATVIGMLGAAGDDGVHAEALRRFRLFAERPDAHPVPGDLRGAVFRTALRGDEEYVSRELRRVYEGSAFPEEQRSCLSVMGCVRDPRRHAAALEYALFSGKVRPQDVAFPLSALAQTTDEGGRACWDLLRTRFDAVAGRYAGGPMWGAIVGLCCRGLTTAREADEVEAFFGEAAHPVGSARRRLEQALEAVRNRAARLERDCGPVAEFLEKEVK